MKKVMFALPQKRTFVGVTLMFAKGY